MTLYPRSLVENKRVVTCRKGGYGDNYGAIYLPMDLVDKYRLLGPVEIIEDEQTHSITLKKLKIKPKAISDE